MNASKCQRSKKVSLYKITWSLFLAESIKGQRKVKMYEIASSGVLLVTSCFLLKFFSQVKLLQVFRLDFFKEGHGNGYTGTPWSHLLSCFTVAIATKSVRLDKTATSLGQTSKAICFDHEYNNLFCLMMTERLMEKCNIAFQ